MKKQNEILKILITLFLTVAIINIYFTNSYCSFTKETNHHQVDLALKFTQEGHHNHHDTDNTESNDNHNEKDDDSCCNDRSAEFFASIINHYSTSPILKITKIVIFHLVSSTNILFFAIKFSAEGIVIREAPPPQKTNVRIFIQSFTI